MSERGNFRGGRGGGGGGGGENGRGRGGGRGGGAHRGGAGGGRGGAAAGGERPKKENILNLGKYMDKQVTVKFNGGREGEFCISLGGVVQREEWELQGSRSSEWKAMLMERSRHGGDVDSGTWMANVEEFSKRAAYTLFLAPRQRNGS